MKNKTFVLYSDIFIEYLSGKTTIIINVKCKRIYKLIQVYKTDCNVIWSNYKKLWWKGRAGVPDLIKKWVILFLLLLHVYVERVPLYQISVFKSTICFILWTPPPQPHITITYPSPLRHLAISLMVRAALDCRWGAAQTNRVNSVQVGWCWS